jgi:hypothetical protein
MSRLSRSVDEVPWDSRNALIDRVRRLDSLTPTVDTFERVGADNPRHTARVPASSFATIVVDPGRSGYRIFPNLGEGT